MPRSRRPREVRYKIVVIQPDPPSWYEETMETLDDALCGALGRLETTVKPYLSFLYVLGAEAGGKISQKLVEISPMAP